MTIFFWFRSERISPSRQCISITMFLAWLVNNVKIIALRVNCPPGQSTRNIFICWKRFKSLMICKGSELSSNEINVILFDAFYQCKTLFMSNRIVYFSWSENMATIMDNYFSAFIIFLTQDIANGIVRLSQYKKNSLSKSGYLKTGAATKACLSFSKAVLHSSVNSNLVLSPKSLYNGAAMWEKPLTNLL